MNLLHHCQEDAVVFVLLQCVSYLNAECVGVIGQGLKYLVTACGIIIDPVPTHQGQGGGVGVVTAGIAPLESCACEK